MDASWLEIDLTALDANLAAWRRWLGGARLCAVVKADCYGLGAAALVPRIVRAGVDMLAVYSPRQALDILALNLPCPVLVFMPARELTLDADLRDAAAAGRIHFSVHHEAGLATLTQLGHDAGRAVPVHLYVDTGMSRAGVRLEDVPAMVRQVDASPRLQLAGLYTHFTSADTDVQALADQQQRFDIAKGAVRDRREVILHAANTFASLRSREYHQQMARVGVGMWGLGSETVCVDGGPSLRHTVRWCSRIVHLRQYAAGAGVGYNLTHRLTRLSRLALIPVGYADGYPLSLSGKGAVTLCDDAGHARATAPVLGRVNMDQMVIDVTDAPDAHEGQLVELISNNPTSPAALPRLAEKAGSHYYELLCRLSHRIPRRHLE